MIFEVLFNIFLGGPIVIIILGLIYGLNYLYKNWSEKIDLIIIAVLFYIVSYFVGKFVLGILLR